MKHLRLIFILLMTSIGFSLQAKPITQLIYEDVKNKKCLDPSQNEINKITEICKPQKNNQNKSVSQLSLDDITEQTVFSQLLANQIDKAQCVISQQKWILGNRDYLNKMVSSTCKKLPQLKTSLVEIENLNQKINGLKKTIDGTIRIVPQDYRLKTEKEIQKLEKIKSLYTTDVQNIKDTQILLKSSGLFQEISDQLTGDGMLKLEKTADQSCQYLQKNIKNILKVNLKEMKASLKDLKQSRKDQEISSNLKAQLWQSSSGFELRKMISKDESEILKNGLICRMESRYGEGVKIRNDLINIGTMVFGGTSFFSGRLVSELTAMNLSKPVLIGRTLVVAEAATEVSLVLHAADQQCQTKIFPTNAKSCEISEKSIQAELDQNECWYTVALGLMTTGLSGLGVKQSFTNAAKVKPVQKYSLTDKEIKSNPQIAIWKLKEAGELADAEAIRKAYLDKMQTMPFKITGHIGEGVNGAKFIEFEDGTKGVWKFTNDGHKNLSGREVAAYKIDYYLEIDQVPMTVEREFNGKVGMVQVLINNADEIDYAPQPRNYSFFDSIIGNRDRQNDANVLSFERRPVAIDHELAFHKEPPNTPFARSVGDVTHKLRYVENESERKLAISEFKAILPSRTTYEKLKNTTDEQWTSLLKNDLQEYQIKNFLSNRRQAVERIDGLVKDYGDDIFRDGVMSPVMKLKDPPSSTSVWDW